MPHLLTKATVDYPDTAPVQITTEIKLKASPEQVWKVLADNPGWTKWYQGVSSCEDTSSSKPGLGSTRQIVIDDLEVKEEFVGWEPNRLWAISVYETDKPVAHSWVERLELEANDDGGTTIRYNAGLELVFYAKLVQCYLVRTIRRAWTNNLARIDEYLESSSDEK